MPTEAAGFDKASEQFTGHYDTVRGYVRQQVTRHNLVEWFPPGGALQVLDFGGGDGRDAIWLAGMGDEVTLLDESPKMISMAAAAVKNQESAVRDRINVVEGCLEYLDGQQYDLVLSHGVLMYELDDPIGQLRALSSTLRSGGVLSLLTKGYEAAHSKADNPEKAGQFNDAGEYINRLGLPTRVYRFGELESMIAQAGLRTAGKYGVRLSSDKDRRSLDNIRQAELSDIVAKEVKASRDPERMDRAQMLHIVARK